MATCPTCQTRDGVEVEYTGELVYLAKPLGTFSLSGNQMKFSAEAHPEVIITHPACGWTQRCYDGGDSYLYPVPDTEIERPLATT